MATKLVMQKHRNAWESQNIKTTRSQIVAKQGGDPHSRCKHNSGSNFAQFLGNTCSLNGSESIGAAKKETASRLWQGARLPLPLPTSSWRRGPRGPYQAPASQKFGTGLEAKAGAGSDAGAVAVIHGDLNHAGGTATPASAGGIANSASAGGIANSASAGGIASALWDANARHPLANECR